MGRCDPMKFFHKSILSRLRLPNKWTWPCDLITKMLVYLQWILWNQRSFPQLFRLFAVSGIVMVSMNVFYPNNWILHSMPWTKSIYNNNKKNCNFCFSISTTQLFKIFGRTKFIAYIQNHIDRSLVAGITVKNM